MSNAISTSSSGLLQPTHILFTGFTFRHLPRPEAFRGLLAKVVGATPPFNLSTYAVLCRGLRNIRMEDVG